MKNKKIILALVAARKNSKEIKNKNLLKIGKESIVNIASSVGLKIKDIDYTILSSDSPKILDLVLVMIEVPLLGTCWLEPSFFIVVDVIIEK